ncbi:MAG: hypothetical protein ACHQ9S_27900 [Candidatus Binatia bacterium]
MRAKPARVLALLSLLGMSPPLFAQTTTTYQAPTGTVSPALSIRMNLTGGGSAMLNPAVGPNCYLGSTCSFAGSSLTYALSDGSTANLSNFNGTFFPLGGASYGVNGQASGTDSAGRNVSVDNVQVTMHITCRSGRGGGCTKVYTGGTLTLTLNATPPATPTATPSPTPAVGATLLLTAVKIRPTSATSVNGSVTIAGSFLVPAGSSFAASAGVTMSVQATGLDASYTWDTGECRSKGVSIRCLSMDKTERLNLAARAAPAGTWTFIGSFRKLDAEGPFADPVTVTVTDESTGISYSGTIATCYPQGAVLKCK